MFAAVVAVLASGGAAAGQSPMSAEAIAREIKPLNPKTVVLVFDITMSTKHGGVFGNERAATAEILRNGCEPGDRVVLLSFGTGYRTVFDKTLATHEDAVSLVEEIPGAPEPGRGTNIRAPHHEALKVVEAGLPKPGAIVLLTDSFNDEPDPTDPNVPQYGAYYSPKGLTVYPDTPENRDYERRLRTLKSSGALHEYGVGVGIAPSGRPIERLPVGPGESDTPDAGGPTLTTTQSNGPQEKRLNNSGMIIAAIVAALAIAAYLIASSLRRPTPVRLKLGDKGMPREYRLKKGAKVWLGGSLASCGPGDEFFPLAGLGEPVASIAAVGGGAASLVPASTAATPNAKVFHNGVALESVSALRIGDEIRITFPDPTAAIPKEYRVRYADPKEPLF